MRRTSCKMFEISIRFFAVSLLVHLSSAFEDVTKDKPPLEQRDLPLILIRAYNRLRMPDRVGEIKKWQPIKKNKIKFMNDIFSEEYFYCPSENDQQRRELEKSKNIQGQEGDTMEEKIDEYCLLRKNKTNKTTERPSCKETPHPKIMKALTIEQNETSKVDKNAPPDYKQITCGSSTKKGIVLSFGYQVCVEYVGGEEKGAMLLHRLLHFGKKPQITRTNEVTIYDLCYNDSDHKIMFTTHSFMAPILLSQEYLKIERRQKWKEIEAYRSPHMLNMKFEEIRTAFVKVDSLDLYKIQLLVPQEDFPFLVWKRPVSHYANASLIHKELQSCWNHIHDTIREHVTKNLKRFNVYTGAFELRDEKGEIQTFEGIDIPRIWVKIVHHNLIVGNKLGIAMIANNYRNKEVDNLITETLACKKSLCENFIEENYKDLDIHVSKHIRCCELNEKIMNLFGEKMQSEEVLRIEGLIVRPQPKEKESPELQRMETSAS